MMVKLALIYFLVLDLSCLTGWGILDAGQPVDLDEMRMSNDGLNGFVTYNTARPDPILSAPAVDKITNSIGKPLIPLPQPNPKRPNQSYNRLPAIPRAAITTSKPKLYLSQKQLKNMQKLGSAKAAAKVVPVNSGDISRAGSCDWMSLRSFKNVSLETSELIVRDEDEQPCYLLSVRGFIRLNENAYFPLANFQSHPRLHRFILTGRPNDGASVRSSYLNCSLLTLEGSAPSSNMRYSPLLRLTIPFKEEIIIRVKCGYLVLQIHGDGFHLTLDSLSFYQDPSVSNNQQQDKPINSSADIIPRAASQMESEHQVFSSEPMNAVAPLLMMPLTSRYSCQNRVVLTGNNSVQLVLDKFELQRLAFSPSRDSPDLPSGSSSNNNSSDPVAQDDERRPRRQAMDASSSLHSKSSTTAKRRTTRDAHVKFNFPSVIRCASPPNPYEPLTKMMDLESWIGLNETLSKMIADRWMPARSSADAKINLGLGLASSCYIILTLLTLCHQQTMYIL